MQKRNVRSNGIEEELVSGNLLYYIFTKVVFKSLHAKTLLLRGQQRLPLQMINHNRAFWQPAHRDVHFNGEIALLMLSN